MDYLQNHIWCAESNWQNAHYDCRHLVSLSSYKEGYVEDWRNLVDERSEEYSDDENSLLFRAMLSAGVHEDDARQRCRRYAPNLKPHVLQWLHDNVPNRKGQSPEQGWAIGSAKYRGNDGGSLTIFFHRKRDAMNFIKTFSVYRKPVHYCQYFTDVRKQLNLTTMEYETS